MEPCLESATPPLSCSSIPNFKNSRCAHLSRYERRPIRSILKYGDMYDRVVVGDNGG
jgi:hypothetical protein